MKTDVKSIKARIFAELSKPEYKVCFSSDDVDAMIGDVELKYDSEKSKVTKCFSNVKANCLYFKMKVWNNMSYYFSKTPTYSQGEIVCYQNNTDDVYFIEYNKRTKKCTLVGYSRRYYGMQDVVSGNFKFAI